MKKQKEKYAAFSLAEALITLLIVSLITIATIPVITKKTRTKENHGKWICTRNAAGKHIQWTTGASGDAENSNSWTVTGDSCSFTPPSQARNFNITAVGGGGGGAGAESLIKTWDESFPVDYYGKYKFLAVGGGGGSGNEGNNCGTHGGGGAGGVGYKEYEITDNITNVMMKKGKGGERGNASGAQKSDGKAGDPSTISVVDRNFKETTILTANGGGGGQRTYRLKCKGGAGGKQGTTIGADITYTSTTGDGVRGGTHTHGCVSFDVAKKVNKQLGTTSPFGTKSLMTMYRADCTYSEIGAGGGRMGENQWGEDGTVFAVTEIYRSGGGGTAGEFETAFVPSFKERKIKVTVGQGGAGGGKAQKGSDGGYTIVEGYLEAPYGKGGKTVAIEKAYTETPGGDGEKTPLYYKSEPLLGKGGLSNGNTSVNGLTSEGYGAGGGGGGVKPGEEAGVGGDGAPGYVLIEW